MPDKGTVLAFDFGEKRIGVAVGELLLRQAHPLVTIHDETNAGRFSAIAALIDEWKPVRLIVGRPVALDGAAHAMSARSTRFANQLRGRFKLPVDYAEERLTSVEAEEKLRESGHKTKNVKGYVDSLAAQIILQCYFEHPSEDFSQEPMDKDSYASHQIA